MKLIFSHTKHLILVIPPTVSRSYVSSTLDQLVHRLLSHLVAFSISLVSKSLVDLSTLLLLLYGAHFLLILVRFSSSPCVFFFKKAQSQPVSLFFSSLRLLTARADIFGIVLAIDSSLVVKIKNIAHQTEQYFIILTISFNLLFYVIITENQQMIVVYIVSAL